MCPTHTFGRSARLTKPCACGESLGLLLITVHMANASQLARRIECAVGVIMVSLLDDRKGLTEGALCGKVKKQRKKKGGSRELNPDLALEVATSLNVVRPAK